MSRTTKIRFAAIVLAVIMAVSSAIAAFGTEENVPRQLSNASKYDSLDINQLTGHGGDPEDISVSAGAEYLEKAWYEYVIYSEHAVSSYRIDDDTRILFYDPYTYSNSLVMEVAFDANTTEFDTMSSYSISHSSSKTIEARVESTRTSTDAVQTSGLDQTGSNVTNTGYSKTIYNHGIVTATTGTVTENTNHEYELKHYATESVSVTGSLESETAIELTLDGGVTETISVGKTEGHTVNTDAAWLETQTTNETVYSDDYSTSTNYVGEDTIEDHTESATEGWSQLSARVTKTIGSSTTTCSAWSETESTTVTKTYAATHFASDGVTPLPWAIVHYKVLMPVKCCMQIRYSGEWVTISTVYSLLTTVKGTCRAWRQDGQVYYEDWGNGEPVVETNFWGQFMTRDALMSAYNNKLYPVGGED